MNVRAKFKVTSKTETDVALEPVYNGSDENKAFFAATPGGSISMGILNKPALDTFEVGAEYYVDFTRAPAPG